MSRESELNVIGSLSIDQSCMSQLADLESYMFSDSLLGRIYVEYQRAYDWGKTISTAEVITNIADYENDLITAVIKEAVTGMNTSAECRSHANVIVRSYKSTQLDKLLSTQKVTPENYKDVISLIEREIGVLKSGIDNKMTTMTNIVKENEGFYFTDHEPPFEIGFKKLDKILGGLMGGELILIGARPAVGKTALVCQLVSNAVERKKRVVFYSLEMSEKLLYERFVARQSGIELQRIKRALNFLGDEKEKFEKANEKIKTFDNLYISTGSKTVGDIRRECKHLDADLIVIDYLQLLSVGDRYMGNRVAEITELSRQLKLLAAELNIPIIALTQLSRKAEAEAEPTMADLRESGALEQDAAQIILLWNVNDVGGKGVKVAKNRQGEIGKLVMNFDGSKMTFTETEEEVKEAKTWKRAASEVPKFEKV